mgnify:CR=1 FL=1
MAMAIEAIYIVFYTLKSNRDWPQAWSEMEETDRTSMIRQLEEHNPRFDPLYLPKAKALIQFDNSANDRFTENKFDDCPF